MRYPDREDGERGQSRRMQAGCDQSTRLTRRTVSEPTRHWRQIIVNILSIFIDFYRWSIMVFASFGQVNVYCTFNKNACPLLNDSTIDESHSGHFCLTFFFIHIVSKCNTDVTITRQHSAVHRNTASRLKFVRNKKKNNKETKRKNVREASLSLIWPKVVEVTVAWPRVKVPQVVSIESAGRERSSETNPVV